MVRALRRTADAETGSGDEAKPNAFDSASRTSPIAWRRSRGFFCKQSRNVWRTAGGVPTGRVSKRGSTRSTFDSVREMSSSSNARLPVSISNRTQPNAQRSLRRSAGLPRACSGLI